MNILLKVEPERIERLDLEKRGEPGTRLQASPGPRTTTYLDSKSRVVT